MQKEVKSFWSGSLKGAAEGAWKGFLICGAIFLIGGLITGTAITFGPQTFFLSAALDLLEVFSIGGLIGIIPGAAIGAAYKGMNDYVQESEVQKEIAHMRALEHETHLAINMNRGQPIAKEQSAPASAIAPDAADTAPATLFATSEARNPAARATQPLPTAVERLSQQQELAPTSMTIH